MRLNSLSRIGSRSARLTEEKEGLANQSFSLFHGVQVGSAIDAGTLPQYFSSDKEKNWSSVEEHTFKHTQEAEAGRSPSLKPAWSTEQGPRQPRLHREALSQKRKEMEVGSGEGRRGRQRGRGRGGIP